MSGFDKERESLETHFRNGLTAVRPALPLLFTNGPQPAVTPTQYVVLTLLPGESDFRDVGENARFRHPGLMVAQIFTEADQGTAPGRKIADDIIPFTRNRSVQSGTDWIALGVPSITALGVVENGRFQTNVTIPYTRDEH